MRNLFLLIVSLSLVAVAMFSQTRKQLTVSALDDLTPSSCQCGSGCGCGCQQTGSCSCSK